MTFKELENRYLINYYKRLCQLPRNDQETCISRAMCAVQMYEYGLEEYLTPEDRDAMHLKDK